MTVKNATIENVRDCINQDGKLAVKMIFKSNRIDDISFILENSTDVKRLKKLMIYTGARSFKELEGKSILKLGSGLCYGFGSKGKDKFVPLLTEEFMELSAKDFEELLL